MKRLVLLMAAAAALVLVFVLPVIGQDSAGKYEGPGFDTPEEAVTAFAEALARNDAEAALSTFAIESMVDHRDAFWTIERNMLLNPANSFYTVPSDNEWIRDLKIIKRYAEAAGYLYNQYVAYTIEDALDLSMGQMLPVRTQGELDNVKAVLTRPERLEFLTNIKFIEVLDPVETGFFSKGSMWKTYTRQAESYAVEDYIPLAAHIRIGEQHGLIFFDCGRYDGRWYNLQAGGVISYALGLEASKGGMVLLSTDEYIATITQYTMEVKPDILTLYKAHLQNELNGTTWKLTEYTGTTDEGAVAESFADLENFGEEKAVFAQLRFTRWGYMLHIKQTPADPETKLTNMAYYGNWREENGTLEMEDLFCDKVLHFGSRLMFMMDDGTVIVFEKI